MNAALIALAIVALLAFPFLLDTRWGGCDCHCYECEPKKRRKERRNG